MPLIISPVTRIILIPQSYLTHVSGTLFKLDTDQYRKDLRSWEESEEGRTETRTHDHNSEYTAAGVTYARKVELINNFRNQFEDTGSLYSVILEGSNNNVFDVQAGVLIPSNVLIISGNSAGLQTVVSGSGVTEQDKIDIANKSKDALLSTESFP